MFSILSCPCILFKTSVSATPPGCAVQLCRPKKELSFGNAPIFISDFKSPEQFFGSEVLPILKKKLDNYRVDSANAVQALEYGRRDDSSEPALTEVLELKYRFDVEGKTIVGDAMILTRNYSARQDEAGLWNGFIVGVESEESRFGKVM